MVEKIALINGVAYFRGMEMMRGISSYGLNFKIKYEKVSLRFIDNLHVIYKI
jgi:hypothetical protein